MRPAYLTITAATLAVLAAIAGITDVVGDSDAALAIGLAIVLAIIGQRE